MTKDLLQFANSLTNYENYVEGILTDLKKNPVVKFSQLILSHSEGGNDERLIERAHKINEAVRDFYVKILDVELADIKRTFEKL